MELKKETLSRINKCNYTPKYHHSDIKVIMGSLRGTKYHSKENAEELLRLRGEGWRWNIVEDAIDAAHLAKCIPIIEKNFKLQQEHEVVKIDDEDYDESNAEEYFDDPQWYENQKGMSDQYNNRGTIDGIISHCDMDDIDDGWREEG